MPWPSLLRTAGRSSHVLLALHGVHENLHLLLLLQLGVVGRQGEIVGIQGHLAGLAVDVDGTAFHLLLQGFAQAADGGDAHGAGQDGGVGVAGAALGHEAQDLGLVQLQGLGGGQVVGGQDHGDLGIDAALDDAHQIVENAGGHVLDVGGAGAHIGVVHGGEHGGELLAGLLDRVLHVAALGLQRVHHALHKVLVLHEHGVGLKEDGSLVAGLLAALLGQIVQLLDGLLLGLGQAGLLGLDVSALELGHGGVGDAFAL